jgi:hypothetical protein
MRCGGNSVNKSKKNVSNMIMGRQIKIMKKNEGGEGTQTSPFRNAKKTCLKYTNK